MSLQMMGVTTLIQVFDMVKSLAFYRGQLGFSVVSASPEVDTPEGRFSHWMWLRLDNAEIMLNTAYDAGERPARPDEARLAAHADTSLFFGCRGLDAVHAAFLRAGVACGTIATASYGLRRFSVRDPDNYELVFQESDEACSRTVRPFYCNI